MSIATIGQGERIVRHHGSEFSYESAQALFALAHQLGRGEKLVIDLSDSANTTIAALAKLIELRRVLLELGSDLRLVGLSGRVGAIHSLHRLGNVLPC
ncbi:MAG: hypothetical protein JJU36_17100 [Phycisphaeraceae bacterium]|nr:hypothetical protein [Phycisphaeraceae bacterium]